VSLLLVLAPMHVEAAAVRGGGRVLRTGMGSRRARIAAARSLAIDADAVAVAGICGAVASDLATGDVVLPTELRTTGGDSVPLIVSETLAAALRKRGLRVHTGPLLSIDHIAGAAERQSLGATGAVALDMETAWLAPAAAGRPFAVVRVVADTCGRRLADPRFATDIARALVVLRRAVPALGEWARDARFDLAAVHEPDTVRA